MLSSSKVTPKTSQHTVTERWYVAWGRRKQKEGVSGVVRVCVCVQKRKERLCFFVLVCFRRFKRVPVKKRQLPTYQHVVHRRKSRNKHAGSYTTTDINVWLTVLPSRFPKTRQRPLSACVWVIVTDWWIMKPVLLQSRGFTTFFPGQGPKSRSLKNSWATRL